MNLCKNRVFGKDIPPLLPVFNYDKPSQLVVPEKRIFIATLNLLDGEKLIITASESDPGNQTWKYVLTPPNKL